MRAGGRASGQWLEHALAARAFEIHFSHQLLLYLALCPLVQAVHLIDVDLWNLFGEHNALRRAMSFAALRLIVWWPRCWQAGHLHIWQFRAPRVRHACERRRHRLICSLVQDVTSTGPSMTETLVKSGVPASRIWPAEHPDIAEYYRFPRSGPTCARRTGFHRRRSCCCALAPSGPTKVLRWRLKRSSNLQTRTAPVHCRAPSAGYTREVVESLADGDSRIILGPLRRLTDAEMAGFCRRRLLPAALSRSWPLRHGLPVAGPGCAGDCLAGRMYA